VKRELKREYKRTPALSEPMAALLGRLTMRSAATEPDSPVLVPKLSDGTTGEEKKDSGWLSSGIPAEHVLAVANSVTAKSFDAGAFSTLPRDTLALMKGILFKRDQPYRTTLPFQGRFSTSSGGLINNVYSMNGIGSTSEWTAIDSLFDEFFIHSAEFTYKPCNVLGDGVGFSASASVTGGITTVADTNFVNLGLLMVSTFNGAPAYTSASALAANATLAVHSTGRSFKYTWRNNQRFDRRGDAATLANWQGWALIANASNYGGQIYFRAINDDIVGTGSAIVTLGHYLVRYDVSFRTRS
jgi:hypothetical protein